MSPSEERNIPSKLQTCIGCWVELNFEPSGEKFKTIQQPTRRFLVALFLLTELMKFDLLI